MMCKVKEEDNHYWVKKDGVRHYTSEYSHFKNCAVQLKYPHSIFCFLLYTIHVICNL